MFKWFRWGEKKWLSVNDTVNEPIFSQHQIQAFGKQLSMMSIEVMPNPKASESQKQGEQASRYLGAGLEYEESRLYQPGDEVRRINWRLMARTGQAYTKLYQEERQESWTLLVDQRQSMRFATRKQLKVAQAVQIAGYYAWQAERLGLPVESIRLAERVYQTPLFEGKGVYEQVMEFLSVPCPPMKAVAPVRLYDELLECQQRLQSGSRLILISDFADLDEETLTLLSALQEKVMLKAIWVVDASEKHLSLSPNIRLVDLYGQQVSLSSAEITKDYKTWSQDYFSGMRQKFAQIGVPLIEMTTEMSVQQLRAQEAAFFEAT